jgi:glycosyltransferase A (GT-A) superfamily protein (DUF2064 family)
MTKVPSPGRGKARLAIGIGTDAAEAVARAFLVDTVSLARRAADEADADLVVHTDLAAPPAWVADLVTAHRGTLVAQGPGDLGARLRRALEVDPAASRVVIGSDTPDLPPALVVAALRAVEGHQAVLGPSDDGGFHLLGLAAGAPTAWLERDIRWSTPHTLADAVRALGEAGLTVGNGAPWTDVDDVDGLLSLARRLATVADGAPRTRAWLAANPRVLGDPPT